MKNNILIIGCGSIGSRHLQSLASSSHELNIYVVDTETKSLQRAKKLYEEIDKKCINKVSFEYKLPINIKEFDVCILSTSSKNRLSLIEKLLKKVDVKYWIIEKILSQNINDLHNISRIIKAKKSMAWVNTPNRTQKWFKDIKKEITKNKIIGKIEGNNWGLMCNTIHYLDLFSWITSQKLISISSQRLNKLWFRSKRDDYMEVDGELEAFYSNGATLNLKCNTLNKTTEKKLSYFFDDWFFDLRNGTAKNLKTNKIINGEIIPQSRMTSIFIDQIINENFCDLPSLDESIYMHQIFLEALLPHWKNFSKSDDINIPIT